MSVSVIIADEQHFGFAAEICDNMRESAIKRGTGIARRTPEYIMKKMQDGDAVIAVSEERFVGFCYIESWSHGKFVANSGLIVHPDYRHLGLAKKIKEKVFAHSLEKYPGAKIFGITTGLAVMKINSELGYKPVPFSELTDDPVFWKGCSGCSNFDILQRKEYKMCLCTGMLYDPAQQKDKEAYNFNNKVLKRLKEIKQALFLKKEKTS